MKRETSAGTKPICRLTRLLLTFKTTTFDIFVVERYVVIINIKIITKKEIKKKRENKDA
jgi:hypothetical protein